MKVDMRKMAKKHLPDFNLIKERPQSDSFQTEYVYRRERDSVYVFITVGLYPSAEYAENIVVKLLNEISMVMTEGPHMGVSIGEKYWWLAPFKDSSILTNLVFIRKNALFIMNSLTYGELKTLAKKIDDDILNEASYINYGD